MKIHDPRYPLVKVPAEIQISLFLIREELKCRKLFRALHHAGIDDCYFQPHLDLLILKSIGIDDETDDTFARYETIIEKRSKRIGADHDSVMKQAFKVYHELVDEKKRKKAGVP